MKIEVSLTAAEAESVLGAELSQGWGVQRSKTTISAEAKIKEAIRKAQN